MNALYYPPIYAWVFQVVSFPPVSNQNPVYTSNVPHTFEYLFNTILPRTSAGKPFIILKDDS